MKRELTARGVLAWLLGFFGVIIAMNVYFITVSARTFRGEDEQKPYLQGVEYNDTLSRRARQARAGWQAAVSAARQPDGQVTVLVRMADRARTARSGLRLEGELRHPADEHLDKPLRFAEVAPGLYRARAHGVAPGRWNVLLHALDGVPFEADRRLWLQ
jgi:nitrogen fixation protein FixH